MTRYGPLSRSPKIRRDTYELRFKPPDIQRNDDEFLIPVVHTNAKQIRALRRKLDGSAFYVKAVDKSPEPVSGVHTIMVKIKRCERPSGSR